jgi:hypothetical protein
MKKINRYKELFKKKEDSKDKDIIGYGETNRIKAEDLHKEYIGELERLKEKFKPKKFEIK